MFGKKKETEFVDTECTICHTPMKRTSLEFILWLEKLGLPIVCPDCFEQAMGDWLRKGPL